MKNQRTSHVATVIQSLKFFLGLALVSWLAGCGPASSDNPSNLGSRASVSGSAVERITPPFASEKVTGSVSERETGRRQDDAGQRDTSLLESDGTPNAESDGRDTLPVLGLPESIAMALDSPDADLRIQALNHWDTQKIKASLDPVFEALEDENEAVRAKATAIIEQAWAEELERERG